MNFYYKRRRWKIILLMVAAIIGVVSFLYTNWLIKQMSREEMKNVELLAEATRKLVNQDMDSDDDITFLVNIISQNTTIPVIIVDSLDNIQESNNIKHSDSKKVLQKELKKMKEQNEPIVIKIPGNPTQYFYYRDSYLLQNLRFYPIIQFLVIVLFIIFAYVAFSSARNIQQNQVWVGMAKETAHQLGTPISSLMAWLELLKMQNIDANLLNELEKDTQRLEKITERFSKIGSTPELLLTNVVDVVSSSVEYLKTRSSGKIKFIEDFDPAIVLEAPLNAALFSWVIENLCKNAIDAMDNEGTITLSIINKQTQLILDISDTGKGISKKNFKTVFEPGFTTKKRGWGLGLSLARRIVNDYHKGKIFLRSSELNKGSTFRIILKK